MYIARTMMLNMLKDVLLVGLLFLPTYIHCACTEESICETPDGKAGVCLGGVCSVLTPGVRNDLKFTIIVKYPEAQLQVHQGTHLYVRGNSLGLSWSKGIKLNKTGSDTWKTSITYQSDISGFKCQHCADNTSYTGEYFQYRIYVDDTTDMVGGNLQIRIPMSKSSSYFEEIPTHYAYPWFFTKSGTGTTVSIESPQLGRNFSILIYKPPSFDENTFKTYPTLITYDLSLETFRLSADLIDAPIVYHGTIAEVFLVGFGEYASQDDRTDLLTPIPGPGVGCINGSLADRCDDCFPEGLNYTDYLWYMEHKCGKMIEVGGKGNETLDFLIDTVIPKVKHITNSRMRTDQPNLGIMGYSLGGLMACHAAWTRPTVFGLAACQSPSLWWPNGNSSHDVQFFFNNVTLKDPTLRANRPYQKIFLDAGGIETQPPWCMTQTMLSAAQDMSSTPGFEWDTNLWAYVFPGEPHSSIYWSRRVWNPMRSFFPTYPAPNIPEVDQRDQCTTSGATGILSLFILIVPLILTCICAST